MMLRTAMLSGALLLAGAAVAQGQTRDTVRFDGGQCDSAYGVVPDSSHPATYVFKPLQRADVDILRASMRHHCWDHALMTYFSRVHMPRFVDWVVYVDSDGQVHQALTQEKKVRTTVRGQRYVWVLFFEERVPPTRLAAAPPRTVRCCGGDTASSAEGAQEPKRAAHELKLTRRSVYYERDPFIMTGLKVISGKLFSAVEAPATATLADSVHTLDPVEVVDGTGLYIARAVVAVPEDAEIELSVDPETGWRLPGQLRGVHMSMVSASSSAFEVGLAGGAPWSHRAYRELKGDTVVGLDRTIRPNVYLMGYWNCFVRPALPRQRRSFGVAWGMNIARGGLLDELVFGLAGGRLVGGAAGVVAGVDLQKESGTMPPDAMGIVRTNSGEKRIWRMFLGLDMRL